MPRGGAAHQQGVEDALMASHYQGLQKWVRDYQAMRQSGNLRGAEEIRDNIKSVISQHGLNADRVWGEAPEAKSWTETRYDGNIVHERASK